MPLPFLQELKQFRQTTQIFKGLNKNPKAGDGEFYDETNLSSASYPCLAPRAKRGTVATILDAKGIGGDHEALAYVAKNHLCRIDVAATESAWYSSLPASDIASFNSGTITLVWNDTSTSRYKTLITIGTGGVGNVWATPELTPPDDYFDYIVFAATEEDWFAGVGTMNLLLFLDGFAEVVWYDTTAGKYKTLISLEDDGMGGYNLTFGDPADTFSVTGMLGYTLYYDGADTGVTLSAGTQERTIVPFGAYLLVFPDKAYYNTADTTDFGSIEATFTTTGNISYTICRDDGTDYDVADVTAADEPPAAPDNGDYWIDTSAEIDTLMQYSSYSQSWTQIPTVYTKIANTGIGAAFSEYDAVDISGCAYAGADPKLAVQIPALNGSKIVYAAGANYIIIVGLLDAIYTQHTGAVTVARTIPDMDYVTVSGNRVWGCFCGENDDGDTVNEIYASRLGDFKNFASFLGISTDSYAVTVGQGGPFTGATSHLGYPIFFKERTLYKVFGSRPSNYQVMETACAGVKDGSDKSIALVGSTLFYLSSDGEVVAYDGAMPYSVFSMFGSNRYSDGVAGVLDGVYYLSVKDSASAYHLFTCDTEWAIWHREDTLRPIGFQFLDGELYALTSTTLYALTGKAGSLESSVAWSATTGMIGWEYPDQKYVNRFNFRVEMPASSSILLEILYDNGTVWESHNGKTVTTPATVGTFLLPVRPRRCDHFRLRITGTGAVKIYSMDRILQIGADGLAHI